MDQGRREAAVIAVRALGPVRVGGLIASLGVMETLMTISPEEPKPMPPDPVKRPDPSPDEPELPPKQPPQEVPDKKPPPEREPVRRDPPTEPPDPRDPTPHKIDDPPNPGAPPEIIA